MANVAVWRVCEETVPATQYVGFMIKKKKKSVCLSGLNFPESQVSEAKSLFIGTLAHTFLQYP